MLLKQPDTNWELFITVPQKISYHRFWKGLVDDAKWRVIEELEDFDISQKQVVDDVKLWVNRAVKELNLWNKLNSGSKQDEVADAIKRLSALPAEMPIADKEDILWQLTSVSLLRLRPFRRTMLWDLFSNLLLPSDYIKERIEKTEANLTSGETAFAAFAASFPSNNEAGMVVSDCRENLRGTYFLIDRAIGLRSNVAVPMRKVTCDEPEVEWPILAMVVVSLPFADAFVPDFTRRLAETLHNYAGPVELMWEYEQLAERAEFEDKPYLRDDIYSIIRDLTPDAETPDSEAVLPGCAILVGEASGNSEMAAAVELNERYIAASPRHQAVFAQSELELEAYGVRDRCISLISFIDMGGSQGYHLMARLHDQHPFEKLPEDISGIFQTIGQTINKSFVGGGKAPRAHRQRETQMGLFGYLLDYLVTGGEQHRKKLVNDLRYCRVMTNIPFDFPALESTLDCLAEWVSTQRSNWTYLSICAKKPVFKLEYPTDSKTYLSGFEVELFSNQASFLLSEEMPATIDIHLRNAAHELGGPRRFIAWCRALNALMQTFPRSERLLGFTVKQFGIYRDNLPDELICYLPSMLLPDAAKIHVTQNGNRISISIESCSNECLLKSSWRLEPTLLPLATVAGAHIFTPMGGSGHESGVAVPPIELSGLAPTKAVFFDLRRMHAATKERRWGFDPAINPSLKPIAKLVSGLAEQLPEWVASMDCLAIVPLPFGDALEIPTFSQWCKGSGRRQLLIAGILRRSAERDVGADWDIEVMNDKTQNDPFIERFQQMLGVMQRRQSTMRSIEAVMQSQFVFTHLSHDICSNENIGILREVLVSLQSDVESKSVKERDLLTDSEMIVDDLEQLRLLSREMKSNSLSPSITLNEVNSYVRPALPRALIHAARKISRSSAAEVTTSDLEPLLNIKALTDPNPSRQGHPLAFVLLDNLIRNALEGAWSYNRHFGNKGQGRVCVQSRPLDHCLVIRNDAEPGRWKEIQQIYQNENTNHVGVTIIRLVSDFLKINYAVQVISETRGEIHLVTREKG
jgi:hypothetical protein